MTQTDLLDLPEPAAPEPIVYPIQAAYVEHWNLTDALREWIANALDTHTALTLDWADGTATIEDTGLGLTPAHFALGASDKRADTHAIGHFGEGWKLGLVVAAARGRACRIDTVGYTLTPRLAPHPHFGPLPVLWLDRTPNTRTVGTRIRIACTEDEWATARAYFLELAPLTPLSPHVFLPGGHLYVMGVRVMALDSLFSYNLTDRDLTNRDRHLVNLAQALPQITALIEEEAAPAALPRLLDALITGPLPLEATLPFHLPAPRLKRAWRAALAPIPSPALGGRPQDDGLAALAGYTVFPPGLPLPLTSVLEACGVPRTSAVAEQIRRDPQPVSLTGQDAWVFPVVPGWVGDMTITHALQELIANALDVDPDAAVVYDNAAAHVNDDGPGIRPDDFLIGHHTDQRSAPYGFFGIGLKAALAALAMAGTPATVDTVGRTYTATFEAVPPLTEPVLVLRWRANTRTHGTAITVPCPVEDLEDARRHFRRFTVLDALTPDILQHPGLVYCAGLLVTSAAPTRFGYDLPASARNLLDYNRLGGTRQSDGFHMFGLANAISAVWSATSDADALQAYWAAALSGQAEDWLEFMTPQALPRLSSAQRKHWRAALRAHIGPKRCLVGIGTGTDAAEYNGYTPLPPLPQPLETFCHALGVPTAQEILQRHATTHTLAPTPTASAVNEALDRLVRACRRLGWLPADVPVSFSVDDRPEAPRGLTEFSATGQPTIRLNAGLLAESPQALLGTLLHEGCHAYSYAADLTADFQRALTEQLGAVAWDALQAATTGRAEALAALNKALLDLQNAASS